MILMMVGMAASPVHKLDMWMELSVGYMRMLVLIEYVLHNSK